MGEVSGLGGRCVLFLVEDGRTLRQGGWVLVLSVVR